MLNFLDGTDDISQSHFAGEDMRSRLELLRNLKLLPCSVMASICFLMVSCKDTDENLARLRWGVHQMGLNANLLNLRPNESVEVCANDDDTVTFAHEAIKQWATAINRWDHIKVATCGQGADLKINISGFGQTGLNYFTERPGRIYVASNSSGNFRKAILLHEFGHSFGMCDQYMDSGSAGCGDHSSPRQENSEIMGSTNASKLALTPGDIQGVKTAASVLSVATNREWSNFLANQGSTQSTQDRSIYARLLDSQTESNPRLAISVPAGARPLLCVSSAGDSDCNENSNSKVQITKVDTNAGRDIYVSQQSLTISSSSAFAVNLLDRSGFALERFVVKRR